MSAARAAALLPPRKEPTPPPTNHEMMLASAIGAAVRIVEKGHREALVAAAASAGPVATRDAAVAKADATFSMRWQTVQEELAKCGFESRSLRSRALADASSGKNSPLMQIGPMDCRSVRLRYQAAHPAWKSDAVAQPAKNLRPAAPPAANAWTTRPPGAAANAAGLKPTPKLAKRPSPPPSPAPCSEHDTPAPAALVEPAMPLPPPSTTHAAVESERRPQPQQRTQPQPQPQPLPQLQRRPPHQPSTAPVPSTGDGPSVATTVLFASGWGGLDPSVLASLSAEAESDALAFRVRSCGRDAVVAGPDGRALPPVSDGAAFTAPWPAAVDDGAADQPSVHSVHCERTASGGSTASTPSPPSAPAPISLPTGVPLRISDVLAAAAANYTGAKFDSDSPLLEPDDSIWDTRPSPVPSPPRAAPCGPASSGCRSRRR